MIESGASFTPAAWAVVAVLVAYLVLVEPWWGRSTYRRLLADPTRRIRTYRLWLAILWAWALGVALVLLLAPGVRPAHVGLAWPHGPLALYAVGFAAYLIVVVLGAGLLMRRKAQRGGAVHTIIDLRSFLLVPAPATE